MAARALLLACAILAGCSGRPVESTLPPGTPVGDPVPVFYASTRGPEGDAENAFRRDGDVEYGRAQISIPPIHQIGKTEVARVADPARHFAIAADTDLADRQAFVRQLRSTFRALPPDQRQAVLFVHGFNTNYAEGLFRHAQIMSDFQMDGVAVSYSWPSRGAALAYVYDRDSALFARDGLEQLIADTRAAGAQQVFIVAHSMGAHLTMEVFRQMAIADPREPARSVNATALLSPDIDVELFRNQVARIDALPRDFVVFVSKRDRALALSARISGESNKLGNVASVDQVSDLNVVLVDISDFANPVGFGHLTAASSPALIRLLREIDSVSALLSNDTSGRAGLGQRVVLTAQEATAVILSPVTAITGN